MNQVEPLLAEGRREFGVERLQGDTAVVLQIAGEVDRRHPPAAELAIDRVTVGKSESQSSEKIGQGLPGEARVTLMIGPQPARASGR